MVVRLDLERHHEPVAHVDRAGVLARAHDDRSALGGQRPQEAPGVLVATVLGPHQREHRKLDPVRLAAELLDDQVVLGVGEPQLAVAGGGLGAHAGTAAARWDACCAIDSNSLPPSTEPVRRSTACSGCGISPITLPRSLVTPAMSCNEPLCGPPSA